MYTNEALGKALEDLTTAYNNFITKAKEAALAAMGDTVIAQIKQDAKDHIAAELAAQKAALEEAIQAAKQAIKNSVNEGEAKIAQTGEAKKEELNALIAAAEQKIKEELSVANAGIAAKIEETIAEKLKAQVDSLKSELKIHADKRLISILENGYVQWPGMPNPEDKEELQFEGYQWVKVNYDGNFFRATGKNAEKFSEKQFTKENLIAGEYIFNENEQNDAIRNITGEVGAEEFDSMGAWSNSKTKNGALFSDKNFRSWSMGQGVSSMYYKNIKFDASKVVPVADENRPRNLTIIIWKLIKKE